MYSWKLFQQFDNISAAPNCLSFLSDGSLLVHYAPGLNIQIVHTHSKNWPIKQIMMEENLARIIKWAPGTTCCSDPVELMCGLDNGILAVMRFTNSLVCCKA